MTVRKSLVIIAAASAFLVCSAGVAVAVSDGHYDPARQHCSPDADESDQPEHTEDGCHSTAVVVSDGAGHEYASVGTQQEPDGSDTPTRGGDYAVDPGTGEPVAGTVGEGRQGTTFENPAADPASGLHLYFGADDNLDFGEHDSSEYADDGPSDGGAIQADLDPATLAPWLAAVAGGDLGYLLVHPVPVAGAGLGACADGVCFSATTERRTAWTGSGRGTRDVADYEGKEWDPESCSGPNDGRDQPGDPACGTHTLRHWYKQEGTTYVEPGVQVYEDPDPEGSPAGPYPLPAAAVTTCGVYAGGGEASVPPIAGVTNDAGQIAVATGCPD